MQTAGVVSRFPGFLASIAIAACSAPEPPPRDAGAPASRPDLVITGGTLLDMTTEEPAPREVAALVVEDGRIATIIEAGTGADIPEADATIDATGKYILPGFFDAHVHFRPFLPGAPIWKRAANHYGITTLFDTGPCGTRCADTGRDPNEWIVAYRDYMNDPAVIDGPTLYITGRRIQPPDGTHPLGMRFSTRAEVADYLDTLVGLGVDGVKAESTLGPELRAAVVEEATKRGLPVVGHSRDAVESIDAGMRFIEHMWPVTSSLAAGDPGEKFVSPKHDYLLDLDRAEPLIASMVENEVYINPTMLGRYGYFAPTMAGAAAEDERSFAFGGLFSDLPAASQAEVRQWWARAADWDAGTLERHRDGLERVNTFLARLSAAGGRVLAATDAGEDKLVGIALHREMRLLADAGLSPYRVLLGATRYPAEMAGKEDRIGTLETGKQADILIVGADPTADIVNAAALEYVIRLGTIVRRPGACSVIEPPMAVTCREVPVTHTD